MRVYSITSGKIGNLRTKLRLWGEGVEGGGTVTLNELEFNARQKVLVYNWINFTQKFLEFCNILDKVFAITDHVVVLGDKFLPRQGEYFQH